METPKTVVMFGGFGHEGLNITAKSFGYDLKSLALEQVQPKTWARRSEMVEDLYTKGQLAACVIYLHSTLLLKASTPQYREQFFKILAMAQKVKAIVFVYQDNLDGIFTTRHPKTNEPMTLDELQIASDDASSEGNYLKEVRLNHAIAGFNDFSERPEEVMGFIKALFATGVEIAPFFTRSDVTIRLQEFLSDAQGGVFLRLYVLNERLHAEQLKSFLAVLERYLKQVEGRSFTIDSLKNENGVVYIFRSDSTSEGIAGLEEAFVRFDSFLKLCGDDAARASSILSAKGIPAADASFEVEKYAREYRRLIIDSKHELERKTLQLRQRLELSLSDSCLQQGFILPQENLANVLKSTITGSNISVNIGSISVVNAEKIQTEVDRMLNGRIAYSASDKELIALFSQSADKLEAVQCRSDLDQLKDQTAPESSRQTAKQRLFGFLRKAASKGGEIAEKIAVESMSKYIESLYKGSGS